MTAPSEIRFFKYQGTGNDFVMIDNRETLLNADLIDVAAICDRRFGVGADGLILIEHHESLDFNMIYFNSDGSRSFCGNGSRCAVLFARNLGMIENETRFLSTDGEHYAYFDEFNRINLHMHNVEQTEIGEDYYFINTGSPHYIRFIDDVATFDVVSEARKIRYNERFAKSGVNVNFAEQDGNLVKVRTYERGVEDETLSCGTGVTAVALANHLRISGQSGEYLQHISTPGGQLSVRFKNERLTYFSDIYLSGPAEMVFEGIIHSSVFYPQSAEINP